MYRISSRLISRSVRFISVPISIFSTSDGVYFGPENQPVFHLVPGPEKLFYLFPEGSHFHIRGLLAVIDLVGQVRQVRVVDPVIRNVDGAYDLAKTQRFDKHWFMVSVTSP